LTVYEKDNLKTQDEDIQQREKSFQSELTSKSVEKDLSLSQNPKIIDVFSGQNNITFQIK
jgi:hypothetical protein